MRSCFTQTPTVCALLLQDLDCASCTRAVDDAHKVVRGHWVQARYTPTHQCGCRSLQHLDPRHSSAECRLCPRHRSRLLCTVAQRRRQQTSCRSIAGACSLCAPASTRWLPAMASTRKSHPTKAQHDLLQYETRICLNFPLLHLLLVLLYLIPALYHADFHLCILTSTIRWTLHSQILHKEQRLIDPIHLGWNNITPCSYSLLANSSDTREKLLPGGRCAPSDPQYWD